MLLEKRWFQLATILFLGFIWGTSFILMKTGLKSFTNEQVAAMRILFAALALLPWAIRYIRTISKKDLIPLLVVGLVGSFIPAFLFTKAQTRIESAVAGMLNSLTPFFTLIIGLIFYKLRFKWWQYAGVFVGLAGAIGLIGSGESLSFDHINNYAFFILIATLCYGISINVVKAHLTHLSGRQITSLSFFFLLPFAIIYLLTMDFSPAFQTPDWGFHLGAVMLLGVMGSAFALFILYSLVRHVTPVFASSTTYIIPIFAIMWGFMDGEVITAMHIISIGLILFGVYLTNAANNNRKEKAT